MRQLTIYLTNAVWLFLSKLPMRQLTRVGMHQGRTEFSKLPMRQLTRVYYAYLSDIKLKNRKIGVWGIFIGKL
jgi:hypothetical protein